MESSDSAATLKMWSAASGIHTRAVAVAAPAVKAGSNGTKDGSDSTGCGPGASVVPDISGGVIFGARFVILGRPSSPAKLIAESLMHGIPLWGAGSGAAEVRILPSALTRGAAS